MDAPIFLGCSVRNTSQLTYGDGIVEQYHLNKENNYILYTTNVNDIHARHIGKIYLDSKKNVMLTNGDGTEVSPLPVKKGFAFLKTTAQHTSRPAVFLNGEEQLIGNKTKIFENQRIPDVIKISATDGSKFMATIFYPDNYNKKKSIQHQFFSMAGVEDKCLNIPLQRIL